MNLTFYKLNTQYYPNSIRVIASWDYLSLNLKFLTMHYWPPFPREFIRLFFVHHFPCFGHQVIVFITIKVSIQTWNKMQEKTTLKKNIQQYSVYCRAVINLLHPLKNTTAFHAVCTINKLNFLTIKGHLCRLQLEMRLMTLQWFKEN